MDSIRRVVDINIDIDLRALTQDEKNIQLLNAIEIGKATMVMTLLSAGASVEAIGRFGYTALILAARRGHSAVVPQLIAAGANKEATTRGGNTALIWAARRGHSAVVSQLITAGANKGATSQFGHTALMWAARNGHTLAVEKLIEAGANKETTSRFGDTALIIAAKNGHTLAVEKLIEAGANKETTSRFGDTALIIAAKNGHPAVVEKLIEAGANKEATDQFGCTVLMHATNRNHEITAFLILSAMSPESRAVLKFGQGGCALNRRLGQHPSARLAVRYEAMASGFARAVSELYQFFCQPSCSMPNMMPNPILGIMLEYLRPEGLLAAIKIDEKRRLASSTVQNQERVERAAVPVTFRAFSCFPSCLRSSESVMTKKKPVFKRKTQARIIKNDKE